MEYPDTRTGRLSTNHVLRRTTPISRISGREELNPRSDALVPPTRRRKSRSPAAQRNDTGKKKRLAAASVPSLASTSSAPEDAADRGRRTKQKSKPLPKTPSENAEIHISAYERPSQLPVKREVSRSRDPHQSVKKHPSNELGVIDKDAESQAESRSDVSSSIGGMELARLRKEMESLKKQAHESKKTIKKQSKLVEDMKAEISASMKNLKEIDAELQKIKTKSKKSEELVSNFENALQCQICMELLHRPFMLNPCGHIACLTCLQEWFRQAPAADNDMYDDDDPDYLMHRRKSCPCCRSKVIGRPVPSFVVKSIVDVLRKARHTVTTPPRASPPPEADPWEGLFLPVDEEGYEIGDDNDSDEDDDDGDYDDDWINNVFSYGTDSEEESYQGEYVAPRWEPPNVDIDPEDFLLGDSNDGDFSMLRRGASVEMLETYEMHYTHRDGLIMILEEGYQLFLGWNIDLSADDERGENFIQWHLDDIHNRPDRWEVTQNVDGTFDARKLVPAEEVDDYSTTDTDAWLDNDMGPL